MNNLIARLNVAKGRLDSAEKSKIVLETQINGLLEELEQLGYRKVTAAQDDLLVMENDIIDMEDRLGEMLNDFESKYSSLLEGKS